MKRTVIRILREVLVGVAPAHDAETELASRGGRQHESTPGRLQGHRLTPPFAGRRSETSHFVVHSRKRMQRCSADRGLLSSASSRRVTVSVACIAPNRDKANSQHVRYDTTHPAREVSVPEAARDRRIAT